MSKAPNGAKIVADTARLKTYRLKVLALFKLKPRQGLTGDGHSFVPECPQLGLFQTVCFYQQPTISRLSAFGETQNATGRQKLAGKLPYLTLFPQRHSVGLFSCFT